MSERRNSFSDVIHIDFDEDVDFHFRQHRIALCCKGKWVEYLCPQCGKRVALRFGKYDNPRWEMIQHGNGTVTVKPSIVHDKKLGGCGAHYFIEGSQIRWV